jgi:3-hydroxyisobutyrate dehydrogenase-like beta-hydroxyacid dehydrogenase
MKPRISVLGAGRMGSALVRAFLKQGYDVAIWNRTSARCEPLAAQGARIAASVREAIAAADIVVANLIDYAASDRLLRAEDVAAALRGKLLVQLASGSSMQAREAASWAEAHAVHYLDGAIMATPNFIGAPGATILYSGREALFEAHRPVLLALGGNAQYVGADVGHASALDSALLVYMWGELFGALQGATICVAEKIPLEVYAKFSEAVKPVLDGALADLVGRVREGRFAGDERTLATVEAHHVAAHHMLELCKEHRLNLAVPSAFEQLLRAAVAAGHGQDDFAALHNLMR